MWYNVCVELECYIGLLPKFKADAFCPIQVKRRCNNMKTKSRRLLSTLLTVMMILSLLSAFPLTASAADQGTVMANFAKECTTKRAYANSYCLAQLGDAYSTGLCSSFREAFGSAKCVYESFPTGTSDFSTYLLNARAQGADVIFAPVAPLIYAQL